MPFKCKDKSAAYHKQYRIENKEKYAAYGKKRYQDNRDEQLARSRQYYQDNKERHSEKNRVTTLKRFYGLTPADYQSILGAQNGCCPICLKHHTEFPKRLAVDHIHDCVGDVDYNKGVSAAVRGLLCNNCNTGIGKLGDSMDNLIRAIGYKMGSDLCPFTLTKRETTEED